MITVFWADNFNKIIDNDSGGGAVDMTTITAFQEYGIGSISSAARVNLPKTKSRKLTVEFDQHNVILNDKQEPDITNFECVESNVTESVQEFSCKFFTWLYLRASNQLDQIHPNLPGMLLRVRQNDFTSQSTKVSKTQEVYLPPLPTKVTDAQTIFSYMKYFQVLAKEMNMPYINITLDVGAAINAFKLL